MGIRIRESTIVLCCFVLLTVLYYTSGQALLTSNDGSHFSLAWSMATDHDFEISPTLELTRYVDYSHRPDGLNFSDRPPGLALVSLPLLKIGQLRATFVEGPQQFRLIMAYTVLTATLFVAGTVIMLYYLLKSLGFRRHIAAITALLFALTGLQWAMGNIYFSHAPAGFFIIVAFYCAFNAPPLAMSSLRHYYLIAFSLGILPVIEYQNILYIPIILGYLWASGKITLKEPIKKYAILAAIILIPLSFVAYYNTVNFGSPLKNSYAYHVDAPWTHSYGGMFSTSLLAGLNYILFAPSRLFMMGQETPGLFILAPILLFSLFGLKNFWQKKRTEAIVLIFTFLIYLTIYGRYGASLTRYLAPNSFILYILLAYALETADKRNVYWIAGFVGATLFSIVWAIRLALINFRGPGIEYLFLSKDLALELLITVGGGTLIIWFLWAKYRELHPRQADPQSPSERAPERNTTILLYVAIALLVISLSLELLPKAQAVPPTLQVDPQSAETNILIKEVTAYGYSWILVREGSRDGQVIGATHLGKGAFNDVLIPLQPSNASVLWIGLLSDRGRINTFEERDNSVHSLHLEVIMPRQNIITPEVED